MHTSEILARMDRVGFMMAGYLLSMTWQYTVLFVTAMTASLVLRSTHAHIRHIVWMSSLASLPVVAILSHAAGYIGTPQAILPVMPVYSATVPVEAAGSTDLVVIRTPPAATAETTSHSPLAHPWILVLAVYVTGAAGFSGLILFGRLRLLQLRRRGTVITDPRVIVAFTAARTHLGLTRPVMLIETGPLRSPLTIGTRHPAILVPRGFAPRLSGGDLKAFALHELAHVKRRDPVMLAFAGIVRALLFFNPLVWYAARQVLITTEEACDDIVVNADCAPHEYASMLVRLVRELPSRRLSTELAAGFIIPKHVFRKRVENILADRCQLVTRLPRRALTGCLSLGLAAVILTVTIPVGEVQGLDQNAHMRGLDENARMIEWNATISAEPTTTLSGRVFDPDGNPVSGATVAPVVVGGYSLTGDTRYDVTTDNAGRYEISLPPSNEWSFRLVAHDGDPWTVRTWANGISNPFTTTAGQRIDNIDIMLTRPATVRGMVVDVYGNPRSGEEVRAHTTGGNTYYAPGAVSGSDGRFEITHIRPGEVVVVTPGVAPQPIFIEKGPAGMLQQVSLAPGQTIEDIKLVGYGWVGVLQGLNATVAE